jgi:hypothetical protein
MVRRLAKLALILACAFTPRATLSAPHPPASPEKIAAARAEADALIAATGAPDLFVNTTDSEAPTVRHIPSNLTCTFDHASPNNELVIGPGPIRGEYVACRSQSAAMTLSVTATRVAPPAAESLRGVVEARDLRATLSYPTPTQDLGPAVMLGKKLFGLAYAVSGDRQGAKAFGWIGVLNAHEWGFTQVIVTSNPVTSRMGGELLFKTMLMRLSGSIPN